MQFYHFRIGRTERDSYAETIPAHNFVTALAKAKRSAKKGEYIFLKEVQDRTPVRCTKRKKRQQRKTRR